MLFFITILLLISIVVLLLGLLSPHVNKVMNNKQTLNIYEIPLFKFDDQLLVTQFKHIEFKENQRFPSLTEKLKVESFKIYMRVLEDSILDML